MGLACGLLDFTSLAWDFSRIARRPLTDALTHFLSLDGAYPE